MIVFDILLIFMMQPGLNFAHVTTAQLSWHVQNLDLVGSSFLQKARHILQDLEYVLINYLWNWSQGISTALRSSQVNEVAGSGPQWSAVDTSNLGVFLKTLWAVNDLSVTCGDMVPRFIQHTRAYYKLSRCGSGSYAEQTYQMGFHCNAHATQKTITDFTPVNNFSCKILWFRVSKVFDTSTSIDINNLIQ